VNSDLIASVDFLPTLCAAVGVTVPAALEIDGQSFLPQLLGQPGSPRESFYLWYARNGGPTATHEFAQSKTHKLYRDGRLFDLTQDWFEEKPPLQAKQATGRAAAEAKKLQAVLDRYANARPAHLAAHVASRGSTGKAGGTGGAKAGKNP
jgi:arylsulfatase A